MENYPVLKGLQTVLKEMQKGQGRAGNPGLETRASRQSVDAIDYYLHRKQFQELPRPGHRQLR